MNKNNFEVQMQQAMGFLQSGKIGNAVNILQNLRSSQPSNPQVLRLLGEIFMRSGQLGKAEFFFRQLLEYYPQVGPAHFYLGTVLGMQNSLAQAYRHLRKACELSPENLEASSKAGLVSLLMGKQKQAVQHFEFVLAREPEHIEANSRLGDAYIELGEFEQAAACFNKILLKHPKNIDAVCGLANIHLLKLEVDQAAQCLQAVAESVKSNPKVSLIYSEICEKRGQLELAIDVLRGLDMPILNSSDKQSILFRLGKLQDKAANYRDAFRHYSAANKLHGIEYQIEQDREQLNVTKSFWSRAFFDQAPEVKSKPSGLRPIFIVGMPRSGTSLTEQVLSSHSEVCGGGELSFLQDCIARLSQNFTSSESFPRGLVELEQAQLQEATDDYLAQLAELVKQAGADNSIQVVSDKMPGNFWHLGLIQLLFPEAKIIHCTREPLDTCLSCYFQNFSGYHPYSYKLQDLGAYYLMYEDLMAHWRSELNIEIFELNYQSLVEDFEATSRTLLEYCELDWESDCLEFYKAKRDVATSSYDQVRSPVHKKSLQRWRHYEGDIGELCSILKRQN